MNLITLLLTLLWIAKVSLLELQSTTLSKWITAQNRFNSFLIYEKDLLSNISKYQVSSTVFLNSEINENINLVDFKAKCSINDANVSSIASSDLCPLKGKFDEYVVLTELKFLYILINGCYGNGIHISWILTDNTVFRTTDLVESLTKFMNKNYRFTRGLEFSNGTTDCSNLCTQVKCGHWYGRIFIIMIVVVSVIVLLVIVFGFILYLKKKTNKVSG